MHNSEAGIQPIMGLYPESTSEVKALRWGTPGTNRLGRAAPLNSTNPALSGSDQLFPFDRDDFLFNKHSGPRFGTSFTVHFMPPAYGTPQLCMLSFVMRQPLRFD